MKDYIEDVPGALLELMASLLQGEEEEFLSLRVDMRRAYKSMPKWVERYTTLSEGIKRLIAHYLDEDTPFIKCSVYYPLILATCPEYVMAYDEKEGSGWILSQEGGNKYTLSEVDASLLKGFLICSYEATCRLQEDNLKIILDTHKENYDLQQEWVSPEGAFYTKETSEESNDAD